METGLLGVKSILWYLYLPLALISSGNDMWIRTCSFTCCSRKSSTCPCSRHIFHGSSSISLWILRMHPEARRLCSNPELGLFWTERWARLGTVRSPRLSAGRLPQGRSIWWCSRTSWGPGRWCSPSSRSGSVRLGCSMRNTKCTKSTGRRWS